MYIYNLCFIICSDEKHGYYTSSGGNQTILPAEAMEDQNPYPFGIDPVNIHIHSLHL